VVGATPRPGRHTVYNFEVHVEHVYHVSPLGLLVHNKPPDPVGPGETPQRLPSRPPNPADPQDPWHPDAVAARARAWARHYGPQQPIVWSSPAVASAARTIMGGGSTVTVGSRQEAWELYYRLFGHRGYTDTTGLSATGAKQLLGGKGGTYHWDTATDAAGRIAGHGATNPHGGMPHLQIQTETGDIIRIYFPAAQ
jgi:hypothetical protein